MISFTAPDGSGEWETRQVPQRTNDPEGTKYSEAAVRDLGRPIVVCDRAGRIIVAYRDNFDGNGLTIVHSGTRSRDPDRAHWTSFDLTTENPGGYEGVIHLNRWERDNILQFLYQPVAGLGISPATNNAVKVGVLEWDAARHFAVPKLRIKQAGTSIHLSWNSIPGANYRVWSGTTLVDWEELASLEGDGSELSHVHLNAVADPFRFWLLEVTE